MTSKVTSCPFMGQLTSAFGERPVCATKSAANTETPPVHTLRKIYGQGFAAEYPKTAQLSEVMPQLNETSLSQLHRDHETHHLKHKIAHVAE
jgi:hypothetical protein